MQQVPRGELMQNLPDEFRPAFEAYLDTRTRRGAQLLLLIAVAAALIYAVGPYLTESDKARAYGFAAGAFFIVAFLVLTTDRSAAMRRFTDRDTPEQKSRIKGYVTSAVLLSAFFSIVTRLVPAHLDDVLSAVAVGVLFGGVTLVWPLFRAIRAQRKKAISP